MVPTARLPVRFSLFRNYGAEGFYVLQTRCYFTEYSRESRLILGCGLIGGYLKFQVAVLPLEEPACCALLHSQ